jgi:pilus assembly protein CpaF
MNATASNDAGLRRAVHRQLVTSQSVEELAALSPSDLRHRLGALVLDAAPLLPEPRRSEVVEALAHDVSGLGALEPLLADPSVGEVMVNGPGRVYVERHGRIERVPLDLDAPAIVRVVERVIAPLGLRLDRASPMVDARLPDGSRLHAVIPPLAIDGPCVTIRRFRVDAVPIDAFGVSPAPAAFLRWAVSAGWNIVVSGGTSAGKTTLLNALAAEIPVDARVVTIEETAELRLPIPHVVRLEARPPNAEGAGAVTVRELVRTALRMRPDRLVVGEVRGAEALDLLQALNTGHDGSLSTVHANGPVAAVRRLESLALLAGVGLSLEAIRGQIEMSVDAVVHVSRTSDGARRVVAIAELAVGKEGQGSVRDLFVARGAALVAVAAPTRPARTAGIADPEPGWFA